MRIHFTSIAYATASALISAVLSASATAQTQASMNNGQITIKTQNGVMGTFTVGQMRVIPIKMSPPGVIIDAKTHTGSITFTNRTADTLDVGLALEDPSMASAGDASTPPRSLVSWMSGLPKTMQLLPHASKQFTLKAAVPNGVTAGVYAARIVATVKSGGKDSPQVSYGSVNYNAQ